MATSTCLLSGCCKKYHKCVYHYFNRPSELILSFFTWYLLIIIIKHASTITHRERRRGA